jgi:hypothetical protein
MVVEKLDHRAASEEVAKIAEVNRSGNALYKAPYYLGAIYAILGGCRHVCGRVLYREEIREIVRRCIISMIG